jgi:uncharacterized membrane protein YqjE
MPQAEETGLVSELRRACATLIELAKTRLDLCATETEQHIWHLLSLTWLVLAALLCAALTCMFAGFLVIAVFWDTHRLRAISIVAIFFFILSLGLLVVIRRKRSSHPRWLSATSAELEDDTATLRGVHQ